MPNRGEVRSMKMTASRGFAEVENMVGVMVELLAADRRGQNEPSH